MIAGARRIDGKATAQQMLAEVADEVGQLKRRGIQPALAVVLVGDDPASEVYVRNKIARAQESGILSSSHRLQADTPQHELLALIQQLNADAAVHGILVQLPLPPQIDEAAVVDAIAPAKDVDGFHRQNVGGLWLGRTVLEPCTPAGCMALIRQQIPEPSGLHAIVVGRSKIVGKPMAALLLQAHCTVTVVHSRTPDAAALCRLADIVVAAIGRPEFIDASWLKPGALVIDVGINRVERDGRPRLVGDVDYVSASTVAGAITPVPGGVGPMTIAFLMRNTVQATRLATAV